MSVNTTSTDGLKLYVVLLCLEFGEDEVAVWSDNQRFARRTD